MVYDIVNPVIEDFKNGNSYAIGGYDFDIVSLFVGPGALKGVSSAEKALCLGLKP